MAFTLNRAYEVTLTVMVSQKVDFCHHFEERSDEKSLNYFRDFSLRSK